MSDIRIYYTKLGTAIQLSKEINDALERSKQAANSLKTFLASATWSGQTKNQMEARLTIIIQYHDALNKIMKNHKKALDNLKKNIDAYNQSKEVGTIKGL